MSREYSRSKSRKANKPNRSKSLNNHKQQHEVSDFFNRSLSFTSIADNERETFYLITYESDESSYTRVAESKLFRYDPDERTGMIRNRGKTYRVNVLAHGDEAYIYRKMEEYAMQLDYETTENDTEEDVNRPKTSSPKNSKNTKKKSEQQSEIESVYYEAISEENQTEFDKKSLSSNNHKTSDQYKLIIDEMNNRIKVLESKLTDLSMNQQSCFYNDIDLVKIEAKDLKKWALKATNILFTKRELFSHSLLKEPHSLRPSLEELYPDKVKLIRLAMKIKFNYDEKKTEQVWRPLNIYLNSKNRNLKVKIKKFMQSKIILI